MHWVIQILILGPDGRASHHETACICYTMEMAGIVERALAASGQQVTRCSNTERQPMAEQLNGYVCRRDDSPELVGHAGTHVQWVSLEELSVYCRPKDPASQILPAVTYIGPDAPQWRDRPTCPGDWMDSEREVFQFDAYTIGEWGHPDHGYCGEGPFFGPIPKPPEVTE